MTNHSITPPPELMETTLSTDLSKTFKGTYLEKDRNSNFPKENTILSPSAQLIWDAFCEAPICAENKLAAALRAAAEPFHWTWNAEMCHKHLIAIADELEAQ
jgi:hypothetical protein